MDSSLQEIHIVVLKTTYCKSLKWIKLIKLVCALCHLFELTIGCHQYISFRILAFRTLPGSINRCNIFFSSFVIITFAKIVSKEDPLETPSLCLWMKLLKENTVLIQQTFINFCNMFCLNVALIMLPLYTLSMVTLMVLLRGTLVKSDATSDENINNFEQTDQQGFYWFFRLPQKSF